MRLLYSPYFISNFHEKEISAMTWEIIAALITIVMCLISLGGIVYKFTKAVTSLENAVLYLKEWKDDADREHEHLGERLDRHHQRLDDHDRRIDDHDRRIHNLEDCKDTRGGGKV